MKFKNIGLTVFLLFFILSYQLKAQYYPSIDSLKIYPDSPTTDDTIKVISYTAFTYSMCPMIDLRIDMFLPFIDVNATYTTGILTALCNSIDTIKIGKLSLGTYYLTYYLTEVGPPDKYDSDEIFFSVQSPNKNNSLAKINQEINIYPNPLTSEINLLLPEGLSEKYYIEVFSIFGQKVKTVKVNNNIVKIDISDLPNAVYYLVISNGKDRLSTQKIIKNAS